MINRDYMILTAIFAVAVSSLTEYILFADKMAKVKKNAYKLGKIMGREEDYDVGYDNGYDDGFDDGWDACYGTNLTSKTKKKIAEEEKS